MNTHAKNAHNTTVLSGSTFSVLLGTGNSSCSVLLSYSFCFFLEMDLFFVPKHNFVLWLCTVIIPLKCFFFMAIFLWQLTLRL